MKRIVKRIATALAVVLVGVPATLELAYQGTIATLPAIPIPPEPPPPPGLQLLPLWESFGGGDSMEIQPLHFWRMPRLLPFEAPKDGTARVATCVATGLLDGPWAKRLTPTGPLGMRLRRAAIAIWISRHYSARQATGTLASWYGWSVWVNGAGMPEPAELPCSGLKRPVVIPGRVSFPGGSVRVPKGCRAPDFIPMGIDSFIGGIGCPADELSIAISGGLFAPICPPADESSRSLEIRDASGRALRACLIDVRRHALDSAVTELRVDLGGVALTADVRAPGQVLQVASVASSYERERP